MTYYLFQWIADERLLNTLVAGWPLSVLILTIGICIFLLGKGADWMIDGVVALAERTRMTKIFIGATIVSLGTTTPEAFVSVMAAWMGNSGLALGNGVGSIIADTGLIFGLSCVLACVPSNRFILNRTGWVQVGSATLLVVICVALLAFGAERPALTRPVGIFFLLLLLGYLCLTYVWAQNAPQVVGACIDQPVRVSKHLTLCWVLTIGGLTIVILSARVLVPSASEIAKRLLVPEDVIAVTMVAFGTSLPELITAVTSIRKGHPDIVVGNVVGADVLNCLFVIGAAATARPLVIPGSFYGFHFPFMLLILWLFRVFISMNGDRRFRRWQGVCLLTIYGVYIVLNYLLNQAGTA